MPIRFTQNGRSQKPIVRRITQLLPISDRHISIYNHRHFAQRAGARLQRLQPVIDRLDGAVNFAISAAMSSRL
jgi:hypothetical protein